MHVLKVDAVTDPADLLSIESEWSLLCGDCPTGTVFQTPEWLIPWWNHLGGTGLNLLIIRERSRLVGLAPFFIWKPATGGRQLLFIGTGISDYMDILVAPGFEKAGVEALIGHLIRHAHRYDSCRLNELRPESPLLWPKFPENMAAFSSESGVCPVLDLPESVGDFHFKLPPRLRRTIRGFQKKPEYTGAKIEEAHSGNLEEILERLFTLHRLEWESRKAEGMLSSRRIQAFHKETASIMLSRGRLRLYGLRINGRVEAALYAFHYKNRVYAYLGGFNPKLANVSPGSILIAHAIEQAIDLGAAEFDFLRGGERYKYSWGAKDRKNYSVSFEPADLHGPERDEIDGKVHRLRRLRLVL